MREVLVDLVKQTKTLFKVFRITGDEKATNISAVDPTMVLFLKTSLKNPEPNFVGQFGIGSKDGNEISVLDGFLQFPSYKTDIASLNTIRATKTINGEKRDTVVGFEFKDGKGGMSVFRTMDPALIPEQADVKNIPWDVSFTPNKSRIAEFDQLAKLLPTKTFSVSTVDGDLLFSIGDPATSATNSSVVVFESGVTGVLDETSNMMFDIQQFQDLMKVAGSNPAVLHFASRGILGLVVQTPVADYKYYLRASRPASK